MGFFNFFKNSKKGYSSPELKAIADEWVKKFLANAPALQKMSYNKDEIYMFCAWILIDWGRNAGYLNKNSDLNDFFETIFKAVRNTGTYQQSDMEQFMFRVKQYKWQINGMLECDYPRTKMFFPRTLFARLTKYDFDNPPLADMSEHNLMVFSDYIGSFWNDVNREIMERFPK